MQCDEQLLLDFESIPESAVQLLSPDEVFRTETRSTLLNIQESSLWERKSARIQRSDLATYFSMWANTPPYGGLIAVGIEDDSRVTGCLGQEQTHLNKIEKAGRELCPDAKYDVKKVETKNVAGAADYILVFRVFYRSDKVVETTSGDAYIRRGDARFRLAESEKRELAIDKGQVSFEQEPCNLEFPKDFDLVAIGNFANSVKTKKSLKTHYTPEQVLANRRLGSMDGRKFVPNIACALLFANDPQKVIPGCQIRFQRLEGVERKTGKERNVIRDIPIEGRIPDLIVEADRIIASQVREFSQLGSDGRFYAAAEYPQPAWYEAIVNACVHRSYSLRNMVTFIRMYDDRLEIESPGAFPPLVTPETIYDVHHRRNFHLMDAMFYMDYVKCENEGTRRMRQEMLSLELPAPEFMERASEGAAAVRVVLHNNQNQRRVWMDADVSGLVGASLFSRLSEDEKRCVNFAAEYGKIKPSDVQRITAIKTWHASKKLLDQLVEQGILSYQSRFSRDPKAHYSLCHSDR